MRTQSHIHVRCLGAQVRLLLYFPNFEAHLALLVDTLWVSCGFVVPHT